MFIATDRSDAITQAFSAHAEATIALIDAGHAYGKAKWASKCPLTGVQINYNEAIRKVTVQTTTGHTWTGYTANRIFGMLFNDISVQAQCATGRFTIEMSRWSKCAADWVAKVESSTSAPKDGDKLEVVDDEGACKGWTFHEWSGKWHGRATKMSTKQLVSSMRRSKSKRLWKLSTK